MHTATNYCNAKTFAVSTKLEDVFTFEHLYESAKKCCKNVRYLHQFWQEHHNNKGYILLLDIKSFFNSINHQILIDIVSKKIKDQNILNLFSYLVNCFGGECGLGLGSQISQVSASIYLNRLDHFIKDEKSQKWYGRYMDDAYIISDSKEELKELLKGIENVLETLKLHLSPTKTHILSLTHRFTFLKRRFKLFENGKLDVRPYKPNIRRYCRKYRKLLNKNLSREQMKVLETTFKGYLKEFNYIDRYTRRIIYGYFKRTHSRFDY